MARYTAVLDACVLVPIALADTLLRVAERGLYRPLWSERILDETADAILEIHPDLPPDAVRRRIDAMNHSFEDALVNGWQDIESSLSLPGPDDRHVVAATIRGRADTIVTANLRDYPEEVLTPLGITVVIRTTSSSINSTSLPRCARGHPGASRSYSATVTHADRSHRSTCQIRGAVIR